MSRIGNKPIAIPDGVEVKVDGNHITVKGPKGTLEKAKAAAKLKYNKNIDEEEKIDVDKEIEL